MEGEDFDKGLISELVDFKDIFFFKKHKNKEKEEKGSKEKIRKITKRREKNEEIVKMEKGKGVKGKSKIFIL